MYKHADMEDLERQLQSVPETRGCLIVTDGVFSMGGDIAKLPEICALAKKYGARVMVDDAHALGVIGKGGRGSASYFGLEDQVDILPGVRKDDVLARRILHEDRAEHFSVVGRVVRLPDQDDLHEAVRRTDVLLHPQIEAADAPGI